MAEANVEEKIEADAEGEASAEVAEPKSRKKKLVIFAGAGVAVLLLAGAGLYFTGMLDHFLGKKEVVAAAPKPLVFYDLPDFLVNLNSASNRRPNFLKLSVSLELASAQDTPRIAALMPRIVDNFQIYLRELRVEDLRGSDGIYRLREELLRRVNEAVAPIKVKDVLFREMLVQ